MKKTYEITAINISGLSNFSIILIPSILSMVLGIFFITSVNPITSVLVKKYESIKGSYERDKDYLAAITTNGIWIKEKNLEINNIIRSSHLKNKELIDVTIYEFDNNNDFVKRIEAESANISTVKWSLKNVRIINYDGKILSVNKKNYSYISMYDIKKIESLYSNLDTISFWSIDNEIKLLEDRGYSTREMEAKLQRSYAFPFFLLSMILLSSVFILGIKFKENNWTYVFIAIIASVLIYFFNDFSAVLGKTEKLPMEIAVWMPIVIVFVFSQWELFMRTKNRRNLLVIFFSIFFVFSFNLNAEEFNITAKEVLIDKENEILVGEGSVTAEDSEGKVINADKITYEKSREFLLAEGRVKVTDIK